MKKKVWVFEADGELDLLVWWGSLRAASNQLPISVIAANFTKRVAGSTRLPFERDSLCTPTSITWQSETNISQVCKKSFDQFLWTLCLFSGFYSTQKCFKNMFGFPFPRANMTPAGIWPPLFDSLTRLGQEDELAFTQSLLREINSEGTQEDSNTNRTQHKRISMHVRKLFKLWRRTRAGLRQDSDRTLEGLWQDAGRTLAGCCGTLAGFRQDSERTLTGRRRDSGGNLKGLWQDPGPDLLRHPWRSDQEFYCSFRL